MLSYLDTYFRQVVTIPNDFTLLRRIQVDCLALCHPGQHGSVYELFIKIRLFLMKLNQCNYNQVEAYGLVPDGRLGKFSKNGGRNTMFILGDGFFLFPVGTVDFPVGSYWKSLKPASGMSDLGRSNNPNGTGVRPRPQVR